LNGGLRLYKGIVFWFVILIPILYLASCIEKPSVKSDDIMLEYYRTGGIAGLDDHLLIREDGKAILTRKINQFEFTLSTDAINQLNNLCEQASFSELSHQYFPKNKGSDLFEYRIIYHGYSVKTMDGAIPKSLQPIINELNQIIVEQIS
jgi:hypothetical protein